MTMMRFRRVAQLWNWLPGFRGVAEHESVHKAAQTLGISPSALSRTVKLLESALGTPLFIRHGTGLQLTELGKELLSVTRDVMRQVDDCITRDESRRGSLGPLAIGATSDLTAAIVARSLAPGVNSSVDVVRIAEEAATDELLQGNLDLVVQRADAQAPELIGERIGEARFGIYAAPDHPLIGAPLDKQALATAQYVVVSSGPRPSARDANVACNCDSIEIARAVCESSALLCVLPDLLVGGATTLHRLADHGEPILLHAVRRRPLPSADDSALVALVERLRATASRRATADRS